MIGILNVNDETEVFTEIFNGNADVVNFDPEDAIIHPGYKLVKTGGINDIALLKLPTPVTLNNVKIASLAEQGADFLGQKCLVSGWGVTALPAQLADGLKEVSVNYVKMEYISTILLKKR